MKAKSLIWVNGDQLTLWTNFSSKERTIFDKYIMTHPELYSKVSITSSTTISGDLEVTDLADDPIIIFTR